MIELVDLHQSFGPKQVLRGFSLRVEEGSTTSLVGFSGAGKSVTLKHIVGLLEPDAGSVKVDDQEVVGMGRETLYELRRRVGYVFQFAALFDSMTIAENLAMGLIKQGGYSEAQIRDRIGESLALVELDGFEERAIAFRPKYLLYDEPTSGLDPVTTTVIDRLIMKMKQELGVTSLVITHDMDSAYRISDRIAMLYDGRVLEEGEPEEIRRTTNPVVKGFVEGRPELVESGVAEGAG